MTATLPDRETDAVTPSAAAGPTPEAPSAPASRRPRQQRPPGQGEGLWTVVSTTATMVALVCLWMAGQVLFLSGFSEERAQDLL